MRDGIASESGGLASLPGDPNLLVVPPTYPRVKTPPRWWCPPPGGRRSWRAWRRTCARAPEIRREAERRARARVRDAEPGLANAHWTQRIIRRGDAYLTDHDYTAVRRALDPHESYIARYPRPEHFLVSISVLEPGATSVLHAGHTNARWRVHLTLTPTEEGCELAGALRSHGNVWRQGEVVVLDDSHLHAVRNRGPRARMILLVDVPRLDLPPRLLRRAAAMERKIRQRKQIKK